MFGARGGVFIAGGIVPRFLDFLARSEFRARFDNKGRLSPYVQAIPTCVIRHKDPAFVGLAFLAQVLARRFAK
jgi:glucokinase